MIRLFLLLLLGGFHLTACSQQKAARLIVRGDDMGYSHSGNEALIKSYKDGIQTSIEVIVPSPWFPEAVKMLKENPGADVGIHLALTSEWDNVKWRPLTDCKTLTDSDGYFYPMVYPNKNYPGQSLSENKWTMEDMEKEIRAQIEMGLKHIPRISHVSAHMGCTNINAEAKALLQKLTKEYNLVTDDDMRGVTYLGFGEQIKTSQGKIRKFLEILDGLEPGKTYIFVEHPGIDNEELRAIHHIGYENVAEDRQGVTDLFTSEQVKKKIRQKNIQLISYKDLR